MDDYTNSIVYHDFYPKELKKNPTKFVDPLGRKSSCIPLNYFLDYFNKVKGDAPK